MAGVFSPGEEHEEFTKWAQAHGVLIDGVAPARFEGRGLGLVASRKIKKGDTLVTVPTKCLLTIDNKEARDLHFPRSSRVHGRLAAYLTIRNSDESREYANWQKTWPTMRDFEKSMPFCWSTEAQDLLPPPAKALLKQQQDKYKKDVEVFAQYIPTDSANLFRYFWLITNTRVFYWDYPNTPADLLPKARKDLVSEDCLAMGPFVDYFNHTTTELACEVQANKKAFTVVSTQEYKAGDEVYVSYGAHSNDFLLVEYGFLLAGNTDDYTTIDHLIFTKLARDDRETLKDENMLGKYTISVVEGEPTACHRTQAALRLMLLSDADFHKFIAGVDDGEYDNPRIDKAVEELLDEYEKLCSKAERALEQFGGPGHERDALQQRWAEIRRLIGRRA